MHFLFISHPTELSDLQGSLLTSVAAENLVLNNACNWHTIEAVVESLPEFDGISSLA